jgi:hypothetical protein
MAKYKFKDIEGNINGDVINFLNEKGKEAQEIKDMVVSYFCKVNNCTMHDFRNYDEVELTKGKL